MPSVRRTKNGTRVVRKAANTNTPEWRLQAAQIRALRAMPEHGRLFLIAGDQNAARRGPQAQVQARATGMTPGEPDLRFYLPGGRVAFIENKTMAGRLSPEQRARHAALDALGHVVVVVKAATEAEAAEAAVRLVREWLSEAQSMKTDSAA